MPLMRVQQTSQVTLSHLFEVDETATDAVGSVTYAFKRLDGTAVVSGTAAHPGLGLYTAVLPGANTAQLDTFTLDWTGTIGGAAITVRDYVEICGGFLFGLKQARDMRPPLDAVKYLTAELAATRIEVEQECELICETTFVPRFCRVALSGDGIRDSLITPHADLRALRAVKVDGVAMAAPEIATLLMSPSGVISTGPWPRSGIPWPPGVRNVIVEYEHGLDAPPPDLSRAAMLRLRSKLGMSDTSVPFRAISFTAGEGGTYRLSTPGRDPVTGQQKTGIPEVDAAYGRWGSDLGGFA